MSCLHDAHATEVDGKNIEGGIRRTLEDAAQTTNKRIGTIGGHCVDHHASCPTAREGLHQGCGQCSHEIAVGTTGLHAPADAIDEHIHRSRGTEHTDTHEDGHQIGDNPDGCRKSLFSSLDKGIIHVYLLSHASQDEGDDNHHQHDIGR